MNPQIRFRITALALAVSFVCAASATEVEVILQQPPPYQFKVEQMWKVTLVNPTQTTYTVSIHGRATDAVEGLIVDGTSATFVLPPGTKVVNPRELVPISIKEANPKYRDVVQNIGGVPTGDYEICVSVINAADGQELGIGCVQTQVENLTRVELLEPANGAVFSLSGANEFPFYIEPDDTVQDEPTPQVMMASRPRGRIPPPNIVWGWLPPTPIPPGSRVTYSLRIVELLGNQSPIDAMRSNPAFFYYPNIYSTIFQYPNAARGFDAGKQYAWKVEVYLNSTFIQESETRVFGVEGDRQAMYQGDYSRKTFGRPKVAIDEKNPAKKPPLLLASLGFEPELMLLHDTPLRKEASGKSPIQFSGSARFSSSMADRVASFSEQPKNRWTAELNPVLTFYGLPFAANFLLSSEQESNRQSINNFGLNFNLAQLQGMLTDRLNKKADELEQEGTSAAPDPAKIERMRDPKNLSENIDRYNVASGAERFFMSVKAFGVGTTYPSYSEYTLSGVPVTGLNVEFNPGIFYMAFAGMKNQRPIENSSYRRSLYAGRLGLGQKENTHIYFTGLFVKDDAGSIGVDSANNILTPQANHVFGTEAKLNFFDGKLALEGEGAIAVLTRDTRDPELESKSIPGFIQKLVDPKISTSFDYTYSGKVSFTNDESATRVSAGVKMVGPGYTSLGAPNIRTDQFGFEGKVDQKFLERHVSIGASFKQYRDNLINWKRSTTTTTAYGANLGFNFPKLPFLRLTYAPYFQKNDDSNPARKVDNKTAIYSAVSGYSFPLGSLRSSTSFVFTGQQTETVSGLADYRTNSYLLTEGVSFRFPLNVTTTLGLVQTYSGIGYGRINTVDVGATASPIDNASTSVGVNLSIEKDRNEKAGFYLSSNVSLFEMLSIDVRAERNVYTEEQIVAENYREFVFAATLTARW
jgi:hypothetical protein